MLAIDGHIGGIKKVYILRFPFSLPPSQEIAVNEQTVELDSLNCSLKKQDMFYVLTISGFPTENNARYFINNVWAGLMWMLVHHGLSPVAVLEPQRVSFTDDPYKVAQNLSKSFGLVIEGPVDGLIDGGQPAVYPTNKQLRTITMGNPTVILTSPAELVLQIFSEGATFPESAKVIDDAKLRVALELYGAYFRELSANAKFLTLVMAFEALSKGTSRTQLVLDLINKWKKEAEELLNTVERESDDAISLECVSRELLFRKDDSIRRQIRDLVTTTLKANGDEDAANIAKRTVEIYDLRSKLVHDGQIESKALSKASSDAKNIVERVLRARFVQKATPGIKSKV
jgi:hypothetical protein